MVSRGGEDDGLRSGAGVVELEPRIRGSGSGSSSMERFRAEADLRDDLRDDVDWEVLDIDLLVIYPREASRAEESRIRQMGAVRVQIVHATAVRVRMTEAARH